MNLHLTSTSSSGRRWIAAVAAWICATGLLGASTEAQWPNWRGPAGNGSTTSGTYPSRWNPDQPAWKVALPGKGSSSPVVWKDRIYLTSPDDGQDAVLAFDLDGKLLWKTQLGPATGAKHRTLGSSCNASPVTDGQGVFVYFKSGHFAALEPDGTVRWKLNLTERFGQEQLFWDQGSSPMLTERQVILARMHQGESWVAGFDKATGTLSWQVARNYKTPPENDNGYTTPILFEHEGQPALLVWGADHLTAHRATDGQLVWSAGGFNPNSTGYWPAIASPVIHDDMVVVPVGRDDRPGQARVFGVKLGGRGDVTTSHRAWQRDDLGVFVTSPAVYDGRVYLLRHRGELVCLDPATGKTRWSESFPRAAAPYYASPLIAQGIIYAAREDGVVFTARVGERFELLGEHPCGERLVATPVAAANRVLFRGDQHLFCVAAP